MQLKKISALLSVATSSLLSHSLQAAPLDNLRVDATAALYTEQDGISVNEDILLLRKEIDESNAVEVELIFDAMSGASPTGAVPSHANYTTTSPSGNLVTVSANETPKHSFYDRRLGASASWEKAFASTQKNTINLNYALETDFSSVGAGDQWSLEFNQRMNILSLSASANYDVVSPDLGTPKELSSTDAAIYYGSDDKIGYQFSLGLSQILDRRSLLAGNIGMSLQQGYLTDPYKQISFLDATTGKHQTLNPYYFERRPDSRQGQNLTLKYLRRLEDNQTSVRAAYEYYWDDWQIQSHELTMQWHYRWDGRESIEFQLRHYQQTAAEFYHYFLVDGAMAGVSSNDIVADPSTLDYASADYRLGALTTESISVAYGWPIGVRGEFKLRAMYLQTSDQTDRFDTLDAALFQASINWQF